MSRLPVTVSWELHNALTNACGGPFADSYLSGAIQGRGILATATETARLRLLGSRDAMAVLTEFGLRLEGPNLLREKAAA